ncbi:MAG: DUF262 domain-containing protein [Pseudobdellovibrionaceae bacterium]
MSTLFNDKDPYNKSFEEADTDILPPEDVVSYNELRSVHDLYRLYVTHQLEIQPDFQREEVWKAPQKTRFIDSLFKRLPIPSMCLADDYKRGQMIVVDGLQRISTIISLLDKNSDFKLSKLDDVDKRLSGYSSIELRRLNEVLPKIENVTIPVTIIRCDLEKKSHNEYIFQIFHRLNKGGVSLNNQEIRNCIFRGDLNDLLFDLYKDRRWLDFIGRAKESGDRFKGQELILRFFAMHFSLPQYEGKLSQFLNDFMKNHQHLNSQDKIKFEQLFALTMDITRNLIKRPSSIVIREALLYGISKNLDIINKKSSFDINTAYKKMLDEEAFQHQNLQEGLSRKDNLVKRLHVAKEVIEKYAEGCN